MIELILIHSCDDILKEELEEKKKQLNNTRSLSDSNPQTVTTKKTFSARSIVLSCHY